MKNKKGMKALGVVMVMVVVVVLIIGIILLVPKLQSVQNQEKIDLGVACGDNEPYIDNYTYNAYAKGTSVSVTYSYSLDGGESTATLTPGSSGTKFAVGDVLKIFSTASGYLDSVEDFTITKCGSNKFTNYVYQADAITLDLLTLGLDELSDGVVAGNTVNITSTGTETSADFIARIKGVRDRSTGQVLLTFEVNDTEVDEMSIKANSAGAKVIDGDAPIYDLFVSEGTAPVAKFAFIVDSVDDGGYDDYVVTTTSETGETLGAGAVTGFVYGNAYAGQWFIDVDGSLQFGWENSDGTLKYEQVATDHDALFS